MRVELLHKLHIALSLYVLAILVDRNIFFRVFLIYVFILGISLNIFMDLLGIAMFEPIKQFIFIATIRSLGCIFKGQTLFFCLISSNSSICWIIGWAFIGFKWIFVHRLFANGVLFRWSLFDIFNYSPSFVVNCINSLR